MAPLREPSSSPLNPTLIQVDTIKLSISASFPTTFGYQLLIQLVLIILVPILGDNALLQTIISGAALILIGIPHGANDYLYRKDQSTTGLLKFLASYGSIIGLYALTWFYLPALALLVFLALSVHHFGQANFENEKFWYPPALLWGIWILVLPLALHFEEALDIFHGMLSISSAKGIHTPESISVNFEKLVIITVCGVIYLLSLVRFESKNLLLYTLQFILVTLWYLITPLLYGFIMAFCIWHSVQSIQHQAQHYRIQTKNQCGNFILDCYPL